MAWKISTAAVSRSASGTSASVKGMRMFRSLRNSGRGCCREEVWSRLPVSGFIQAFQDDQHLLPGRGFLVHVAQAHLAKLVAGGFVEGFRQFLPVGLGQ